MKVWQGPVSNRIGHTLSDGLASGATRRKEGLSKVLLRSRFSLEGRDWRRGCSLLSLDQPKEGRLFPLLFLSEVYSALKVFQYLMFCVWRLHWTVVSPKRQRVRTSPQDVFTSQKNVRTASYTHTDGGEGFFVSSYPPLFFFCFSCLLFPGKVRAGKRKQLSQMEKKVNFWNSFSSFGAKSFRNSIGAYVHVVQHSYSINKF